VQGGIVMKKKAPKKNVENIPMDPYYAFIDALKGKKNIVEQSQELFEKVEEVIEEVVEDVVEEVLEQKCHSKFPKENVVKTIDYVWNPK
jgi:hypothetical protein